MSRRKPLCPVYDQDTGDPNHRCNKKTKRGSKFCPEHDLTHEVVFIPCTGEAHGNPYIDHCMLCAPRWGQMEVMQLKDKNAHLPSVSDIPELE
jgi:hypothetical protein